MVKFASLTYQAWEGTFSLLHQFQLIEIEKENRISRIKTCYFMVIVRECLKGETWLL